MLEVARAYALADLGRFDDAVAAATLALPMLRAAFGDGTADDLAGNVAEWQAGRMSILNESALDLARKAIARAETAVDASDQAKVLAEASRAILPPGAAFYRATSQASIMPGWDEVDVRELVQMARAAMAYAVPGWPDRPRGPGACKADAQSGRTAPVCGACAGPPDPEIYQSPTYVSGFAYVLSVTQYSGWFL